MTSITDIAARLNGEAAEREEVTTRAARIERGPQHADLGNLLDDLVAYVSRYVRFTNDHQPRTVALWILHTWLIDQCDYTPYLHIYSAVMRSGKSRLKEVIMPLCYRGRVMNEPTAPVLFRTIDKYHPTYFIEEADAIFGKKAEEYQSVRSVLNGGFERGMTVSRLSGPRHDIINEYDTFCPKAILGIRARAVPDTVRDRSIPIELVRREAKTDTARYRKRRTVDDRERLLTSIVCFTATMDISEAEPECPPALNDRAEDIWEPLLAIADEAGGHWPALARSAATALSVDLDADDQEIGIRLLSDIRQCFIDNNWDDVHSRTLFAALSDLDETPWGKDWSPHRMSRTLHEFHIKSKTIWINGKSLKGYKREMFEPTWTRLLPKPERPLPDLAPNPAPPLQQTMPLDQQSDPAPTDEYGFLDEYHDRPVLTDGGKS